MSSSEMRFWDSIKRLWSERPWNRGPLEQDLDRELQTHLDLEAEERQESGSRPIDAHYASRRAFGSEALIKEDIRAMWGTPSVERFIKDIRYAGRTLTRSPGFTLAAILALALGIGANTAVFSVVNGILLRPLPYADPDRLVMVFDSFRQQGAARGSASMADFLDWKAKSRSFQALDAFEINRFTNSRFTLTGDAEPEQVIGYSVTSTFFETLGSRPILGRAFTAGEDAPGRDLTVVLSESLWRRRYASNPAVLGKPVVLNGQPHTIIGVMPGAFEFWQRDVEAWAILPLNPPTRRGPFFMRGVARLKPGVTLAQASAEMDAIAREVEQANPRMYTRLRFPVISLREIVVGDIRPLLWVLSGAVALVLLISVSNVANLMLARATARQREIAIRLSIGAGRGQLVRQFMTESIILSFAGGALGTALAVWGVAALQWLAPRDLPRLSELSVDTRVLAFTALVSLASAVLFGLAPALAASSVALGEGLKEGGRGGESRRHGRTRSLLVVAQVTFSVLLLIGAGLLIRSFTLLGQVNPGFHASPDRLLTMFISPTGPRFDRQGVALAAYWVQLLDRVRALPGVEAASLSNALPPDRRAFSDGYEIESKPSPPGSQRPPVPILFVSHDYFKALGVPLLRGRWFDHQDTADSKPVTVISDAMVRRHFPGENPIGQRLKQSGSPYMEIVGVVGDVKYQGLDRENEPAFYQLSFRGGDMWLLVRTRGDAQAMAAVVRQEIRALDAGVPVDRVGAMAQALAESVSLQRFRSLLMTVFAVTALLLAAIGIYGVIAYSVAQRRQEIGVRMALGATRSGVIRLVVGQGSRLAIVGIVLGLAGAVGLTRFLEKMLFGVTASDTVTFAGAAIVLGAVAIVASLIPALRAAGIDPVTALRQE